MSKIIPFGNRILVKRKKIGEKAGAIFVPDSVKERDTDIAEVISVPDLTHGDKEIIGNAGAMVASMVKQSANGKPEALTALLQLNTFLKIKSIKPGDKVFISKYVGTTFFETGGTEEKTIVDGEDIIGCVMEEEKV